MSKAPFKAKKSLGQNFLTDETVIDAIAEAAVQSSEDWVLEIGPGHGAITGAVAERAERLICVELDSDLIPALRTQFILHPNVEIVEADILKTDINALLKDAPAARSVVGNLPYYITTPVLMKFIEEDVKADRMTVMVQKEVAERIAEGPGSKTYGILSVLLQAWYDIEYLFTVGSGCFAPPPKVESAVIRLRRNSRTELGCDEKLFKTVVKTAFGQRRKMMRNPLKPLARAKADRESWSEEQLADFLAREIFTLRPEKLSVEDFIGLTNLLA